MKEKNAVNKLWSKKASREDLERRRFTAWMNHPFIDRHYINMKISGNPDLNWLVYVKNKYVPKSLDFGLNLGCGDGGLERHGLALGVCEKFDAFDIAEGALELAKAQATQQGIIQKINYKAIDIDTIRLEKDKYEIAFCSMSAHHFSQLEHVFDEVKKALKPGGLFILNEYIGPSQFQYSEKQLKIMNDILAIMPDNYKHLIPAVPQSASVSFKTACKSIFKREQPKFGPLKDKVEKVSKKWMNKYDPSEAIRSEEIIPKLSERFEIIEKIDYGGTLLHLLLQDIVGNFDERIINDTAFLKLLCYLESVLINEKILTSDFALIISGK
jgi:SAM-dependent methyltransferase